MRLVTALSAILASVALAGIAQSPEPKPELLLYRPSGPPLSYEAATIKPIDSNTTGQRVKLPPVGRPLSIRRYIMDAYGAMYVAQIIDGPDWLNKDSYDIKGKVPDDLEAAFQTMKRDDRIDQNRSMQQSLLADRFHLKAHFETRILPVYELVPARSGLKITKVDAPSERKPGDQPPPPPHPGGQIPPGASLTVINSNGLHVTNAHAIKMELLARIISSLGATEIEARPIVDHTGFSGYLDFKDLTWAPLGDASAGSTPDAPSFIAAIEKQLGLKLVPARDPIEVLVIDSIDRPSEN